MDMENGDAPSILFVSHTTYDTWYRYGYVRACLLLVVGTVVSLESLCIRLV
jgi:hypothetical protein